MQIFNDKKQRVGILKGFKDRKIVKTLNSGDRELSFKYPSDGEKVDQLKTIIMVTHDPQMASYCSRLILLKDGVILEDLKNSGDQELFYQEILGKMKEL